MSTRADLITRSAAINDETGAGGITPAEVGSLFTDLTQAVFLELEEVTSSAGAVTATWNKHVIIEAAAGATAITVASLSGVDLQSFIVLENYGAQCTIALTDGTFRGTAPSGGWVVPADGKVHLQITGTGKVSIVGV
ncbi:MAG: hypothetical protein ACRBFS_22890 [Aureispira sp.]